MTYCQKIHIESAMSRGKEVEQFLGLRKVGELGTISWLTLRKRGKVFVVIHHEQYDEGREDFLDIYEFTYIDLPNDRFEPVHNEFPTLDDALSFAQDKLNASPNKWVGHGMVQSEYGKCKYPR